MGVSHCLLYDGFFSFAVVRQAVPYSMCILQVQSYFEVKSILLICKAVKQKKADPLRTQQASHIMIIIVGI